MRCLLCFSRPCDPGLEGLGLVPMQMLLCKSAGLYLRDYTVRQQHLFLRMFSFDVCLAVLCALAGKVRIAVGPSIVNVQGLHSLNSSFSSWLRSNAMLLHSLTVLGPGCANAEICSGFQAALAAGAGAGKRSAHSAPAAHRSSILLVRHSEHTTQVEAASAAAEHVVYV